MRRVGQYSAARRSAYSLPFLSLSHSRCGVASRAGDTYLDYLDYVWNKKWIGTSEVPIHEKEATFSVDPVIFVQEALGLNPPMTIFVLGAISRFATLFFSLYGERASQRMRNALHRLKAPHEAYQRVYYREGATALDIQLAATILKSDRRRVFKEEMTSNLQCMSSLLGAPIVLWGMMKTKSLCESPQLDFGTSPFLWCTALTMPDPLGILPLLCCALVLINFELSIGKELRVGWMSNIVWGARLGCLCAASVVVQFRSGVCLYFVGMSTVGLLQPMLLRSSWFRRRFDFPIRHAPKTNEALSHTGDVVHRRLSIQFPYLGHLFDGGSEENISLLNRSPRFASDGVGCRPTGTFPQDTMRGIGGGSEGLANDTASQTVKSTWRSGAGADAVLPPSRKGMAFATSGWKAPCTEFSEEDLVVSSDVPVRSRVGRKDREAERRQK
ncbi:hypothetical protein ERJ75_001740600 [Trypanosoma vivax]|nr:preprotein translocase subunit YidC [Trypanosoma vivax]KAH8604299.1 hypothetical protein ERJ75_001740600 [Trypanosoma vivax]